MQSQWFYRIFGEEFGPVDESTLRELHDAGTVGDSDEVRRQDDSVWAAYSVAFGDVAAPAAAAPATTSESSADDEPSWYYQMAGEELGPLSFRELQQMAENGMLTADDEVKLGAQGKYRRVGSIGRLVAVLPYESIETIVTPSHKPAAETQSTQSAATTAATSSPPPAARVARYHPPAHEPAWYAAIQGNQYGPSSLVQLSEWLMTGQLSPQDYIKYGPYGQWLPAVPTVEQSLTQWVIAEPPPLVLPPPGGNAAPSPVAAPSTAASVAPTASAAPPAAKPTPASTAAPAKVETTPSKSAAAATSSAAAAAATAKTPEPAAASTPKPSAVDPAPTPARTMSPAATATSDPSTTSSLSSSRTVSMSSGMGSESRSTWAAAQAAAATRPPVKKAKSSGGGGLNIDLSALTGDPKTLWTVVGVVVAGALLGLFFLLPPGTADEKEKLEQLQQILADFRRNRQSNVGQAEWSAFSEQSMAAVKPIVEELKTSASRKYPARQYLLWASRDRLPQVLEGAREKPTPAEEELEYNLKKAASLLGLGPDPDLERAAASGSAESESESE